MPAMTLWSLTPPVKWQAGTIGGTPFYFDCAGCGAKEPPIAGIISTDGTFKGVGIEKLSSGFYNPCMYCQDCYERRVAEARERGAAGTNRQQTTTA